MYTAANNVPFNIRLIKEGDKYGLNDCLTHDDSGTMIEFYDARYPHTEHGQFVSRYYLRTLSEHPVTCGLDLDGSIPAWTIDGDTLDTMLRDALAEVF